MPDVDAERPIRLSTLPRHAPTEVVLTPSGEALERLRLELDLLALRKVRLSGKLEPEGRRDMRLTATLGATAVQACVVSLDPVTTRIDHQITRVYTADATIPTEAETEAPEDDSIEPLPDSLDLLDVLRESLALALPDFPRASGSAFEGAESRPEGAAPLSATPVSPFAALAAIKPPEKQ